MAPQTQCSTRNADGTKPSSQAGPKPSPTTKRCHCLRVERENKGPSQKGPKRHRLLSLHPLGVMRTTEATVLVHLCHLCPTAPASLAHALQDPMLAGVAASASLVGWLTLKATPPKKRETRVPLGVKYPKPGRAYGCLLSLTRGLRTWLA